MATKKMTILESVEVAIAKDRAGKIHMIGRVTKGDKPMEDIFMDCVDQWNKEADEQTM